MRLQILVRVLAWWCAIGLSVGPSVVPTTLVAATQQQSSFVIIVNKSNPVKSLTIVELRRIFMKQSRMWPHAEPMVPVDWDGTSPIREMFSRQVLNRSVREMAEYWVQQSMTQGIAPPSTQRSARAVLRFVASVPGAISYVPVAEADDTVRVIKITGLSRAAEGEFD